MNCVMVILNYNDSRRAWSLAQKCNSFENIDKVIIVDNFSSDDSVDFFSLNNQNHEIDIVLSKENNGFASGNNLGARYALRNYNPKYLFFANTDTIFKENDVEACLKQMEHDKNLGLVSMRMKDVKGKEEKSAWRFKPFYEYLLLYFWVYRHSNYDKYTYKEFDKEFQYVDVVRGSFMMFRSEAFLAAGYFDESTFLYYEEDIISYRLKEKAYKVGVLTDHFYIHNHIYLGKKNAFFIKHHLDRSLKYFLTNYYKIGVLKRLIFSFCAFLGDFDLFLVEELNKRRR